MEQITPKRLITAPSPRPNNHESTRTDKLTLTTSSTKQYNLNSKNQFLSPKETTNTPSKHYSSKSQVSTYRDHYRINVTPNEVNNSLYNDSVSRDDNMIFASPTLLNNKHGLITTFLEEEEDKFYSSPKNFKNGFYKIEDLDKEKNGNKKFSKIRKEEITPLKKSENVSLKIDYSEDQYSIKQGSNNQYKAYSGGIVNFFDAGDSYYPSGDKNYRVENQDGLYKGNQHNENNEENRYYVEEENSLERTPEEDREFQYDKNDYEIDDDGDINSNDYQNILNKIRNNFFYNFGGGGKVLSPVTEQKSMEDKYDSTGYIFHSKISSSLKDFHNNLPSNHPKSSKYSISQDRAALGSLDQKQALYLLTSLKNQNNVDRRMTFDTYENKRFSVDPEGNATSRSHKINKEKSAEADKENNRRMKKRVKITNLNMRKQRCPELSTFGTGEDTIPEEATPIKNYEVEGIGNGTGGNPSLIGTNTLNSTYEFECDVLTVQSVNQLIGNLESEKYDSTGNKENNVTRCVSSPLRYVDDEETRERNNRETMEFKKRGYFGRRKFSHAEKIDEEEEEKEEDKEDILNENQNYINRKFQNNRVVTAKNFDLMGHSNACSRSSSKEEERKSNARSKGRRMLNYNSQDLKIKNLRNLESLSPLSSKDSNERPGFNLKEENVNDLAKTIKNTFPKIQENNQDHNNNRRINFYDDMSSTDMSKTTQLYPEFSQQNFGEEVLIENFKETPLRMRSFNQHYIPNYCDYSNETSSDGDSRPARGSNLEKNYTSRSIEKSDIKYSIENLPRPRTPVIKKIFRRKSKSPVKRNIPQIPISKGMEVGKEIPRKNFEIDVMKIREINSPDISHTWGEDLNYQEDLRSSERYRKTIEKYNFNSKSLKEENSKSRLTSPGNQKLRPKNIERFRTENSEDIIKKRQKEEREIGESKSNIISTFREEKTMPVNNILNSTTTPRPKTQLQDQNGSKPEIQNFRRKISNGNMKVNKPEKVIRSQLSSCDSNKNLQSELQNNSLQSSFILQNNSQITSSVYGKGKREEESKPLWTKSSQIQSELAESIYGKSGLKYKQPSVVITIEDVEEGKGSKYHHSEKIVINSMDDNYEDTSRISLRNNSRLQSTSKKDFQSDFKAENLTQQNISKIEESPQKSSSSSIRSFKDDRGLFSNLSSQTRIYPMREEMIKQSEKIKESNITLPNFNSTSKSIFFEHKARRVETFNVTQTQNIERNQSSCSRRSYQFKLNSRNVTPVIQSRRHNPDKRSSYIVSKRAITPLRTETNLKTSLNDRFNSVKTPSNIHFNNQSSKVSYKVLNINTVDSSKYKVIQNNLDRSNVKSIEPFRPNLSKEPLVVRTTQNIAQRSLTPVPLYSSTKTFKNYNSTAKMGNYFSNTVTSSACFNRPQNEEIRGGKITINSFNNEKINTSNPSIINNRFSLNPQNNESMNIKRSSLNPKINSFVSYNGLRNNSQDLLRVSRRSIENSKREFNATRSQAPSTIKTNMSNQENLLQSRRNLNMNSMKYESSKTPNYQRNEGNSTSNFQVRGSVFESAFNIANLRKRNISSQNCSINKLNSNFGTKESKILRGNNFFDKENQNINRTPVTVVQTTDSFAKKIDFSNPVITKEIPKENSRYVTFYQQSSREPKKKNILSSRLNFGNKRGIESCKNSEKKKGIEKKTPYDFNCESRTNYFRRRKVAY